MYDMSAHLLCPVVFGFCVEELIGSAPRLSQGSQHVLVGHRAKIIRHIDILYTYLKDQMDQIKKKLSVQSITASITMIHVVNVDIQALCFVNSRLLLVTVPFKQQDTL